MIEFRCPHCRAPLKLDARMAGMSMACPSCVVSLAVPTLGFAAGRMLGGYRVKQYLGSGGFGEVYQVYQVSMDRTLALKVLAPDRSLDARWADALAMESRALARVRHAAVVHAVDAGEVEGCRFLATWMVEGDDLAWRVGRAGRMPQAEVIRIGFQAALALGHAWEQHQAAHGNLKPTNVMLDQKGEVFLVDFGLIRPLHAEAIAAMNPLMDCTANYISPEQAAGQRDPDFRTDLYSLGATLYYAATGVAPYFGAPPAEIVERLVRQPLPPAQMLNPALGREVSALLASMMATDRERRPASWREVITEFEALAKQAKVAAPPAPTPAPAPAARPAAAPAPAASRRSLLPRTVPVKATAPLPPPSRTRGVLIDVLTVVVLLGIGLANYWYFFVRKPDQGAPEPETAVAVEQQEATRINRADVIRQELAHLRRRVGNPAADRGLLRRQLLSLRQQADEAGVTSQFTEDFIAVDSALSAGEAPPSRPGNERTGEAVSGSPDEHKGNDPAPTDEAAMAYAREKPKIMQALAASVLADRVDQTGALLKECLRRYAVDQARTDLEPLQRTLSDLASPAPLLAASFRTQLGQVVQIEFKTGEERLRILEAMATSCRADRVVVDSGRVVASAKRPFRYDELGLEETLKRVSAGGADLPPMLGGLLTARAGAKDRAVVFFRQLTSPWAVLLADQLEGKLVHGPETAEPGAGAPISPQASDADELETFP